MPRAELLGRLRYRGWGAGPRLSLLHVRLSAAAERALRGCRRREGRPEPVIAFQGSQGFLTVPGRPGTPSQVFVFSISRCSRDEPWGSLECVRLAGSRQGQSWLDSLGTIQAKITVCAPKSICQWPREPVNQAKEPRRVAVEPDPAALGDDEGVSTPEQGSVSAAPPGAASRDPQRTRARPAAARARASLPSRVQPWALQPHWEPKQLEGPSRGRPGWAQLPVVLDEDTKLDPTACCGMRGILGGKEQDDRTGNTARERLQHRPSASSSLAPLQPPPELGSPQTPSRNLLGVKCPVPLDFSDPRASERSRVPASSPGSENQHQAESVPPGSRAEGLESPESQEEAGDSQQETTLHPEQHLLIPSDARSQPCGSSVAEIPDYLREYPTVCSEGQRRAYEVAFSTDYTEYRCLHSRIGNVSRRFTQLGAKMKMLRQGTEERKALEATIVQAYSHLKKTYPSYQQEKQRCEYLHQKLSHIKRLILQFEGSGSL